ncbi:DNA glycosylase [Annulohypoxylon maeteangense]|uniref:DNA glycosylase n=1 Tax=Annulohypoxylon maeteangense TaxID=1927788 RepID=UPI002007C5D8|nr:DNA glycosylase [Annulohypoxylon maeteangense]KAI0880394.1 DNA glycosylase [Annulohypoxylon maeteangense]
MDWMWQEYQATVDKMSHNQLADDFLFGFEIGNDFQRWYVADLITSGYVPEDDMNTLTHLSLMRGFEELDQLVSCASSMRGKASFDNPLDGQDTLTFISKILHPVSSLGERSSALQTPHQHAKNFRQKLDDCRGKIELGQAAVKRGKDKQSPFWSTLNAESSQKQVVQSADDLRQREKKMTKGRRKSRKKNIRKRTKTQKVRGEDNKNDISSHALPTRPVLREATRHRSNKASVSGFNVLREISLSLASTNTEVRGSLQCRQSPLRDFNDGGTVSNTIGSDSDLPHEGGSLDKIKSATGKEERICSVSQAQNQTPKRTAKSPYFNTEDASPSRGKVARPLRGTVSCIPFPRLDAPKFGLIQEDLATDPFRLLIAVTFLIRVKGKHALPVFHELMSIYPTPEDLAEANADDIIKTIKHLGLAIVRTTAIQKYARIWIDNPPRADVRYDVKNYPGPSRADIRMNEGESLSSISKRLPAWEIGHMTQGRYAIDSWRIFCRDVLLGRAEDWRGKGREGEFQPEWMRVLPEDKELRACLRWLWMQEGWTWDPRTGDREVLSEDLRKAVDEGRVAYGDAGELKIVDK